VLCSGAVMGNSNSFSQNELMGATFRHSP